MRSREWVLEESKKACLILIESKIKGPRRKRFLYLFEIFLDFCKKGVDFEEIKSEIGEK